jgi:hypothetical protein
VSPLNPTNLRLQNGVQTAPKSIHKDFKMGDYGRVAASSLAALAAALGGKSVIISIV